MIRRSYGPILAATMAISVVVAIAASRAEAGERSPRAAKADTNRAIEEIVAEAISQDSGRGKDAPDKAANPGKAHKEDRARSQIYRNLDPADRTAAATAQHLEMSESVVLEDTQISLGNITAVAQPEQSIEQAPLSFDAVDSAAIALGNHTNIRVTITSPSIKPPLD